jgi:ferrous iron transport protein B
MVFAAVMAGLFVTIFSFSSVPMDLIELVFAGLGSALSALLPDGAIHDLMVDGVVGGIAGTVVFLPQICMLFFLISLLEDSGYLARAAFIADRFMRRFGLPGQAFVPLLSAHACAIPAVMSARLIPSPRDRLRTIFVAPFMSCSARLPVYVLLISLLFPGRPVMAGLAFAGCYALGIAAAIFTSVLMRHSLVRGPAGAMMIELPAYKLPSVRTALLTTFDRGVVFLRDAGTVILAICVVLWWASAYPQASAPPAEAVSLRAEAARLVETEPGRAEQLEAEANSLEGRHDLELSAVGRIGHAVEPVFRPLGMDWQLGIGVLTSFAAREVFVSSMAVITAASDDTDDPEVLARIATAKRDDGTDLFTTSNAAALLVFYVLAMQCLPTLAVVRRETGSWKWPLLQLVYMTVLAYTAALLVRWLVLLTGAS